MAMNRQTILNKPKNARGTLRRLLEFFKEYRAAMLVLLLLCLCANLLQLAGPDLAGRAINAAIGPGQVDFPRVYTYAAQMLFCFLVSSILTVCINILLLRIGKQAGKKMRDAAFQKVMALPLERLDQNGPGDLLSRVFFDVDVISTCIATELAGILTNVVTVVGSLIMMVYISPPLSLVAVAAIPASVWFTAYMRKKTQPRYRARSGQYGAMNALAEELITARETIQAYAYTGRAKEKFSTANTTAAEAYRDAEFYGVAISPTINFISYLSLSLIAMFGSLLYMGGSVSLGQISSFILYSRKFSGPIDEISSVMNELFSALAAAERVFELLDTPEELPVAVEQPLETVRGEVAFDQVTFGYDANAPVLRALSLIAPAGKLTAIVGPTGAGKTTILNLLMRFYDPQSGSVCLDGRDTRTVTRPSLRRGFAMVLQDTWLFEGTVYENIAYGKDGATREEVIAAAKAAHIHPFILRLPQGYDTVLHAGGGGISKGQMQLLAIARAMLCDGTILILDEATSNVDVDTERRVQAAMRELMRDKTCIVIAHRLSTIRDADQIMVVDHGVVTETGTHQTLMSAGGQYRKLFLSQFE